MAVIFRFLLFLSLALLGARSQSTDKETSVIFTKDSAPQTNTATSNKDLYKLVIAKALNATLQRIGGARANDYSNENSNTESKSSESKKTFKPAVIVVNVLKKGLKKYVASKLRSLPLDNSTVDSTPTRRTYNGKDVVINALKDTLWKVENGEIKNDEPPSSEKTKKKKGNTYTATRSSFWGIFSFLFKVIINIVRVVIKVLRPGIFF